MKFTISKEFDFCYGHRVWSQTLDPKYSIDNKCVCRHLHGHQGKIIVRLSAGRLNNGMVTDFKHLNWFKKFVDDNLDHKFIIDRNDPLFEMLVPIDFEDNAEGEKALIEVPGGKCWVVNLDRKGQWDSEPVKELLEGYVIVDFVPTSENISKWLAWLVETKMKDMNIVVESIEFKETPKTSATFYG